MTTEWTPSSAAPQAGESPLQDFWGKLVAYPYEDVTYEGQARPSRTVKFQFIDVDVIDSLEPWTFPTAELAIRYSDPQRAFDGNNRWGHLSASTREIFGRQENNAYPKMLNKRQHWKRTELPVRTGVSERNQDMISEVTGLTVLQPPPPPDPKPSNYRLPKAPEGCCYIGEWIDVPTMCWQVVEVEGAAEAKSQARAEIVDGRKKALAAANGRTEEEFYAEVSKDATIMRDQTIGSMIMARTFVSGMLGLGLLSQDAVTGKLSYKDEEAVAAA